MSKKLWRERTNFSWKIAAALSVLFLLGPHSSVALAAASAGSGYIDGLNNRISSDWALDWVIQDVCVDLADNPVAGDPASCPHHRNVHIGERVPYLITDMDHANGDARYQALFSYPVPGTNGDVRALTAKNMAGNFNADFQFNFDARRDGYDLMDTSRPYFSFIRTSDGGCLDQMTATNESQRTGGWILFAPDNLNSGLDHNIRMTRLNDVSVLPSSCVQSNTTRNGYQSVSATTDNSAHDVWNPPTNYNYESGKVLWSIVTYHFANKNLSQQNNALERYFFTREYGFTRWEAWEPLSRCISERGDGTECHPDWGTNSMRGRCNPGTSVSSWGGQTWVRVDCRDNTYYMALNHGVVPVDSQMAQNDGVADIDNNWVVYSTQVMDATIQTEQRLTDGSVFDAQWYVNHYPDLAAAFGGDLRAATRHWINSGVNEGRQGSPIFAAIEYLQIYGDLVNAFGWNGFKSATQHYVTNGRSEGRAGLQILRGEVYNADWYRGTYPDLAAAFGSDNSALARHWAENGINEGRQAVPWFSPPNYLHRYQDLVNAFGAGNYRAAAVHFVTNGIREGRSGQ